MGLHSKQAPLTCTGLTIIIEYVSGSERLELTGGGHKLIKLRVGFLTCDWILLFLYCVQIMLVGGLSREF